MLPGFHNAFPALGDAAFQSQIVSVNTEGVTSVPVPVGATKVTLYLAGGGQPNINGSSQGGQGGDFVGVLNLAIGSHTAIHVTVAASRAPSISYVGGYDTTARWDTSGGTIIGLSPGGSSNTTYVGDYHNIGGIGGSGSGGQGVGGGGGGGAGGSDGSGYAGQDAPDGPTYEGGAGGPPGDNSSGMSLGNGGHGNTGGSPDGGAPGGGGGGAGYSGGAGGGARGGARLVFSA